MALVGFGHPLWTKLKEADFVTRYQLRLRSAFGHRVGLAATPLSEEVLASVLPATQYSLTPLVDGYELAVDLEGRDHAQTIADLASAFRQLGFGVAQATIVEFASSWLEGGALGALGGSVLGAATKSAEGFVGLALFGMVVGALAGGTKQIEKARYFAAPTSAGWQIVRQEAPPATRTEPAF